MDTNFWFYTLSTIPQALGAIIALTATFVIFRLNHIEARIQQEHKEIKLWVLPLFPEKEIDEISKLDDSAMLVHLKKGIKKLDPKKQHLGFSKYNDLFDLSKEVISSFGRRYEPTEERIYNYILEKARILESLLVNRKNALRYLKSCLLITVVPIVASIVLLPLYTRVMPYDVYIVSVLVGLAGASVLYTAYCIWKIAHLELR